MNTQKIMIEQSGETQHAFFYHSKIARMIRDTLEKRTTLPRRRWELAACLVAGMFDSKGHMTDKTDLPGQARQGRRADAREPGREDAPRAG